MADDFKGDGARNLAHGLEVAVGAILGYFVGNWLDHRYGWKSWGMIVGVMVGVAAGMYLLIKDAIASNKK